ncbi:uncharacterized protein [Dysidea avara]|uniref:uncharacterized protein n=1 Tax=Dysidea avara TaxID=196820 RepID=UPI00332FA8F7
MVVVVVGILLYSVGKESCKEIYDWNQQSHNRSGYYWLINPLRNVYCNMEQRVVCGNIGGWTRIASVNITKGDECPIEWTEGSRDGISFCRSPSNNPGCYPVLFPSNGISYQKVCGMARGYQKGSPDSFNTGTNPPDGLSITHGDPRIHIWSYVIGIHDASPVRDASVCPCGINSNTGPDSFVGPNHYCESGYNQGNEDRRSFYLMSDPLWDGLNCPTGNTCCDNPNLPWFYRELDMATMDDVEVRICADQAFADEGVLIDQLELYVQ